MKVIINKIMNYLGYVPKDSLMYELYESAKVSFIKKKTVNYVSSYYKFKVLMVDIIESFPTTEVK
jgi:hypothetical protein